MRALIKIKKNQQILKNKKYLRDLSKGNQKKVGIIATLIGNPEVVILDEKHIVAHRAVGGEDQVVVFECLSGFAAIRAGVIQHF